MIEPLEANRTSYLPPFYNDFLMWKSNCKIWKSLSAVICRPELYKRDRIIKTRLATNVEGYFLRLVLLFEQVYSDGTDLI